MINCKNAMIDPKARSDFIIWVADNAPMPAIRRAIMDDFKVEMLGGFEVIPPSFRAGFIIRVRSYHKVTWNVAITVHEDKRLLKTWVVEEIPWEHWIGKLNQKRFRIYDGDNPKQYLLEKVRVQYEERRKNRLAKS